MLHPQHALQPQLKGQPEEASNVGGKAGGGDCCPQRSQYDPLLPDIEKQALPWGVEGETGRSLAQGRGRGDGGVGGGTQLLGGAKSLPDWGGMEVEQEKRDQHEGSKD